MALQISIYNKQQRTSASDKSYLARVCVFNPGQSGRLTEADQVPPFYIRDQKGGLSLPKTSFVRILAHEELPR